MRGPRWANGYTRGRVARAGKEAGKTCWSTVFTLWTIFMGILAFLQSANICDTGGEPSTWDEAKGVYCIEKDTHQSLPLCGIDEDDVLWEALIRDEDLVQLVVHRLPGNLWAKWETEGDWWRPEHVHQTENICREQIRNPILNLRGVYLCYETWFWRALTLHAAGPVTLGLGVLPVFHGGTARTPLQPVLHFTEETKHKMIKIHGTDS